MRIRRGTIALLAFLVSAVAGCGSLSTWMTTPSRPWTEMQPPPAPDYADEANWAALPERASRAKSVPPGLPARDPEETSRVDVFFLHPTTYFWRWYWNAPPGGGLSDAIIGVTLAGQAGVFNASGQIYAPYFRQMTLQGYQHPEARVPALDLAYSDVRRAFLYFLEHYNHGKPIILAGHSQGSDLLLRLNREFFAEGSLRDQLIASYPVGTRVYPGDEGVSGQSLPRCDSPEQIGCMVTWRSFLRSGDPDVDIPAGLVPPSTPVCVNPLTWRADEPSAPPSANLGTIPLPYFSLSRPQPGMVGAECEDGTLWITRPRGLAYSFAHPNGNYHAYDYGLFYVNIREDAKRRVRNFFEKSSASEGDSAP